MQREDFLDLLGHTSLGRPVFWFDSTDSTNTQALRAVASGEAGHGAVFIAGSQTAGRGTDGHAWESRDNTGLWMSLVLRSDQSIGPDLTLLPAVAIARVLREKWGIDAHLKWPNDVMVGPKKMAGILVESIAQAAGIVSVVGIGINLNQLQFTGELAQSACSARMILDRVIPLPVFFAQLIHEIEAWWRRPHDWVQGWLSHSHMVGLQVLLRTNELEAWVTVTGLSPQGYLCVRDAQGCEQVIMNRSGLDVRVRWEPQDGSHDHVT